MQLPQPLQNLIAIILVLGLGLPVWLWIRAAPEPPRVLRPAPGPVPVRTARVEADEVRLSVLAFGTLEPARRSVMAAEVAGRIARRLEGWRPGRKVTTGQELLALDDSLARLELRRIEALQVEAERALEQRRLEVELAPAREQMARENHELMQREVERIEKLLASGSASPSLLDQTRMASLSAELSWREASDRMAVAESAVAAAEAGVQSARAGVARATEQLERHVMRAPFDGELAGRGPDVGTYLTPGAAVAEVVDRSLLHLVVHVPEHESGRVALGSPATVLVPARPDWSTDQPLRVRAIAPEADAATRTLAVELDVPAGGASPLSAGLFATAEIELGRERAAVVVARRHLVWEGDRAVAYVVARAPNSKALVAERRELSLGPAVGEGFVVRAGLAPGDELVTGPLESLSGGRSIERQGPAAGLESTEDAPPLDTPGGGAEGSR